MSSAGGPVPTPDGRIAAALGVFWVCCIGWMLRAPSFPNPKTGLTVSLGIDAAFLAFLYANQRLQLGLTASQTLGRITRPAIRVSTLTAAIMACSLAVAVLSIQVAELLARWGGLAQSPYAADRRAQVMYYFLIALTWTVTAIWLRESQRRTESLLTASAARQATMESEMRLLRTQLDAHFLFNALNAIAVEIQDHPRRALHLVRHLSQYLRYSLETADRVLVAVAAEIAALRSFLRVQEVRFGSRLVFTVAQQGTARGRLIPAFLIQPLVENAVKHGIPGDDGILRIAISVVSDRDTLVVEVDNPGDLLPQTEPRGSPDGTGTGLVNLRRRLAIHYPGRHGFTLRQDGDTVRASLRLVGDAC